VEVDLQFLREIRFVGAHAAIVPRGRAGTDGIPDRRAIVDNGRMTDDMQALKTRLKAMWMSGDYARFATYMLPGSLEFLPALRIRRGERVLDVGCGAGQLSLPVSHAGGVVTAVDIASNLVAAGKKRAAAEGLSVDFQEGDAEALAFPDASFDLVFSFIGAMFAPRPERVAAEMTRVCRPGGRVVMGNWTPTGFVGRMFKIHAKHFPPPPGMPSPLLWGDEATARARLGPHVSSLTITHRTFPFGYPFPPAGVVDVFRDFYGPTNRAFTALDAAGQAALRADLEALWTESNTATDGTTRVGAEYLEVSAVR
jgi:SAM-dependent methyltransferase